MVDVGQLFVRLLDQIHFGVVVGIGCFVEIGYFVGVSVVVGGVE